MYTLFKTIIIDELTLKENCVLSSIYHLNKSKKRVIAGLLAESLKISQRSMTDILKKLSKLKYITIKVYYDVNVNKAIKYYYASSKTQFIYAGYIKNPVPKDAEAAALASLERERKAEQFREDARAALVKLGIIKE